MRRLGLLVAVIVVVAGCGGSKAPASRTTAGDAPAPLRIGTKNFAEQFLLGELYKQALEAKGIPVVLKENIGSSEIIHQALTDGALDMYPEYVGVLLSEVANVRARLLADHTGVSAEQAAQAERAAERQHGEQRVTPRRQLQRLADRGRVSGEGSLRMRDELRSLRRA